MRRRLSALLLPIVLVAALAAVGTVSADGGIEVEWTRSDNGTTIMTNGLLTLAGTAGSADSNGEMEGGGFALTGGVWGATIPTRPSSTPIPGLTIVGLWVLAAVLLVGMRLYGGSRATL
jgi:hypothetical protein